MYIQLQQIVYQFDQVKDGTHQCQQTLQDVTTEECYFTLVIQNNTDLTINQ
jgi:ABC-type uncharacterized transport system substrate-binding protein